MVLAMPEDAACIIRRLNEKGYPAYAVGGCVRDALLQKTPKDWDICTGATPAQMQEVFAGWHVVETGLQHGTLTVVCHHTPYEVTTFRTDGEYTDHRHPDSVIFVQSVEKDLARRDFTINAMAWHPAEGLVDCFGGQEDLQRGLIRCVGNPVDRFTEDALRILRALRFASVYGFAIEAETAAAIHQLKDTIAHVAAERIQVEMTKLLCGDHAADILRAFRDVVAVILPEIAPCFDFDQKRSHHLYDVWEHILHTVAAVPPIPALRWAALFHDTGKPHCFTLDEAGNGHAYGHQAVSAEIAKRAVATLRLDKSTADLVTLLTA